MLAESREACKRMRKLDMVWKTGVTHRIKKLKYFRALEKLAAEKRSHRFDWCDVNDGQWFPSRLPPTPEETTAIMWADVNALRKEISLSEKEKSEQRIEEFVIKLEQRVASCTDERLSRFERIIMERRGRAAAHAIVASTGTSPAQPSNPDRIVREYPSILVFGNI